MSSRVEDATTEAASTLEAADRAQATSLADAIVAALRAEAERGVPPQPRATTDEECDSAAAIAAVWAYLSKPNDGDSEAHLKTVHGLIETNPCIATSLCDALEWPYPFPVVFREELDAIAKLEALRIDGSTAAKDAGGNFTRVHRREIIGLAFSGGGIRSATFNLGVLQGLAKLQLLDKFHYLSTVSGGGYIGAWLGAWASRAGFDFVSNALVPAGPVRDETAAAGPIRFLREFSNYLTPKHGLFSADTWTMVTVYLRNVLLNLTTLVAMIAAVLLVPRLLLFDAFRHDGVLGDLIRTIVAVVLNFVALAVVIKNLREVTSHEHPHEPEATGSAASDRHPLHPRAFTQQWAIQFFAVVPILSACYLLTKPLWRVAHIPDGGQPWTLRWWWAVAAAFGLLAFVSSLAVCGWGGFSDCYKKRRNDSGWGVLPMSVGLSLVAAVAASGMMRLALGLASALQEPQGRVHLFVLGPPVLLLIIGLTTILGIGLMGIDFPDAGREWFSRFGAWMAIYLLVWLALCGASIYGPPAVAALTAYWSAIPASLVGGWIVTTISSVLAARHPSTGPSSSSEDHSRVLEVIALVGPPVFAAGFVTLIGVGVDLLLVKMSLSLGHVIVLGLLFAAVALLLAWRVDINEFSMHHFYKNRLVRCYLGASHRDHKPNAFTGFDKNDDVHLTALAPGATPPEDATAQPYTGPFPIINAALNYTAGDQLAWQERKAVSFVFTPLFCGFEAAMSNGHAPAGKRKRKRLRPFGFRRTKEFAYQPGGIAVGTATAISGAAVNPNQGYHTSSALAFLLTVFDVRLGWWLGNPRSRTKWRYASPRIGLMYLVKELFGLSDDRADFVSVSDGGHFDNLGIYELVRRRCSVIVACDAEADEGLTFNGLAGAVRKCRTDFDVEIDIDPSRIAHTIETKFSKTHCVVGTIAYPENPERPGLLIYLKSSLTGEEPADVREYASSHAEFPHQTTADQWFDESQFESYRRLGLHVATSTFAPALHLHERLPDVREFKSVFNAVQHMWYPPSPGVEANATKHTRTYAGLLETLRTNQQLAFLDKELFPSSHLPSAGGADREASREAFYFCSSLIQLLEDIWTDFKLEDESQRQSPYVDGWMNLYRAWIRDSPTVQRAWDGVRDTYGKRFQAFWNQLASDGASGTATNHGHAAPTPVGAGNGPTPGNGQHAPS